MTNLGALLHFGSVETLMWQLGLGMATCNLAGALVGTQLALRHGSGLVRGLFLVLVSFLISRFGWELLHE